MKTKELHVTEIATGEVVRVIDVSMRTEHAVERTLRGLLMQMDTDRFVVAEVSA